MNLVWHIIKKDYRRHWPALVVLALIAFTGSAVNRWPATIRLLGNLGFRPGLIVAALGVMLTIFSIGVICAIIQEDNPAESRAFWRSRPVSPGRLLAAKGIFLAGIFLVTPAIFAAAMQGLSDSERTAVHFVGPILLLPAVTITALLASATKNLARFFATGVLIYLGAGVLMVMLVHFTGRPDQFSWSLRHSRDLAAAAAVTIIGVTGLLNQYFSRRTAGAMAFLFASALAFDLIRVLWNWDFIG